MIKSKISLLVSGCFCFFFGIAQTPDDLLKEADASFAKGDWKNAASKYEASLKVNGTDGRAWYHLGEAYRNEKRYEQAIDAYKKGIESKSQNIPPVFIKTSLAKVYALKKDSVNAINLLSEMVNMTGYTNFPDLDTASEYQWMKSNLRFTDIRVKAKFNAYPCLNNPKNKEFDFWEGNWVLYQNGTNYEVGRERIDKTAAGCMFLENWTATGYPNEGKSMNFISPVTGKWEQVWMGSGGQYLNYYNGEYKEGAMRYEGDGKDRSGNKIFFHLTYFNLGPNNVRQLLEQSNDGKTWQTLYDFKYERIK